jgi:hypothetical protein
MSGQPPTTGTGLIHWRTGYTQTPAYHVSAWAKSGNGVAFAPPMSWTRRVRRRVRAASPMHRPGRFANQPISVAFLIEEPCKQG